MALCDYYLCDACGGKSFYDADGGVTYDEYKEGEKGSMKVVCEHCKDAGYYVAVISPEDVYIPYEEQ